MPKKRKKTRKSKKPSAVVPRSPPELGPLGVWRTNFDYAPGESPYHGKPISIPEYRKRRERRQRRKKMAELILQNCEAPDE
ncbi:MAG TPA: hypothetical protein VMW91_03940 [Desulfosporosinus sp.]|nr:hypothetical protein [Desulfosporosinus sp.]